MTHQEMNQIIATAMGRSSVTDFASEEGHALLWTWLRSDEAAELFGHERERHWRLLLRVLGVMITKRLAMDVRRIAARGFVAADLAEGSGES